MPEFKSVELTWTQLRQLEHCITALKVVNVCRKGELKDEDGNIRLEWDENEVKFNLPE